MEDRKITAVGETETAAEVNNTVSIISQAVEKINRREKPMKDDPFAVAIGKHIKKALTIFCEQNEEFARAVLDGGSDAANGRLRFGVQCASVGGGCGRGGVCRRPR